MPKRKTKTTVNRKKPEIGDYVEVELIDSGATWSKDMTPPDKLALSVIRWKGELVRQDSELTVVDTGGTVEDNNYSRRHNYHLAWTPAIKGDIRLIRKCRKNRR